MNTFEAGLIGLILPPVVSLLKSEKWPDKLKFLISLAISFVVVGVVQLIEGNFHSWQDFLSKGATTWAMSQVVYQLYFGETTLNSTLTTMSIMPGSN